MPPADSGHDPQQTSPPEPAAQHSISSPALWLLLALVIEKPGYGEELNARYDQRYGLIAPARSGSERLRRLEQLGLLTSTPSSARPSTTPIRGRRVYFDATSKGVQAHRAWLTSPAKQEHWRAEMLARIATSAPLGPAGILTLISRYHEHAINDARYIEQLLSDHADQPDSLSALTSTLVLQEQRLLLAAQRQWAQLARGALHEHNRRTQTGGV